MRILLVGLIGPLLFSGTGLGQQPNRAKQAPAAARPAAGGEEIRDFHSDILVRPDGSLTVTETILVEIRGTTNRHGIYRDFPTRYGASLLHGTTVVPFEVLSVSRDGGPESYHLEHESNGKRIRLGQADTPLSPGSHRYVLTYRTSRQLGFGEQRDELYWNVTGSGWNLPIVQASATVTLPEAVPAGQIKTRAYTGPQGARSEDYKSRVDAAGKASFETTRPLKPGEDFAIVVSWPKGFVAEPGSAQQWEYFLEDNAPALVVLGGLVVLGLFYGVERLRGGAVPVPGEIVARQTPPEGLAPAAVRYVWRMGFDRTCLAAAVVDMAVKGYLRIEQDPPNRYALECVPDASPAPLSEEEQALGQALFRLGDRIDVQNANHAIFQGAIAGLKRSLSSVYRNRAFLRHGGTLGVGIGWSVLVLGTAGLLAVVQGNLAIPFLFVWLAGWSVAVTVLAIAIGATWQAARGNAGRRTRYSAGCLTAFAMPFFIGEIVGIGLLGWMGSIFLAAGFLALIAANVFYFLRWFKTPTEEGRLVMDQIEGFRVYLAGAKAEVTQRDPTEQAKWFEKYLPYALALGLEQQWAAKFSTVLGQAATAPDGSGAYYPLWYTNAGQGSIGDGAFVNALGSSFSSAIASASTAPGTSSGSDGGGSAGGGGGGGSGGVW
jgi:hypothetical protein